MPLGILYIIVNRSSQFRLGNLIALQWLYLLNMSYKRRKDMMYFKSYLNVKLKSYVKLED